MRAESGLSGRGRLVLVLLTLVAAIGGYLLGKGAGDRLPHQNAGQAELWTCSMHPQVIQDHPGLCPICHMALTPLTDRAGEGALAVDAAVVQAMGVRTARVASGPAGRAIRAFGTLFERETDHVDVNLRITGWIDRWNVYDGLRVAEGDTLFTLSSPELSVAIDELRAAARQRADDPRGVGAALWEASRRKLELWGFPREQVEGFARGDSPPATVPFASPIDGHVALPMGVAGASVHPGDRVMRLTDDRVLWLDLRVNERDLARVKSGAAVAARVDAFPDETFAGVVQLVHPFVDEHSQTALVRAQIGNADLRLHAGQSAWARIEATVTADALLVPRAAVIDTGERAVVFVALGGGRFEPREVRLGADAEDGNVAIESGLERGEEVVASGQFLLDSESRLRESVMKFRSSGGDVTVQKASARPEWADAVDPLVSSYLTLSDALGAPQASDAPLDVRALDEAARALVSRSSSDPLAVAIAENTAALGRADLATQRELFKRTGDLVIDLVTRVPPSGKVGGKLYVLKCPMAPGRWLQRDPGVKNPFYGSIMKECGEVVGPVELDQGGRR